MGTEGRGYREGGSGKGWWRDGGRVKGVRGEGRINVSPDSK